MKRTEPDDHMNHQHAHAENMPGMTHENHGMRMEPGTHIAGRVPGGGQPHVHAGMIAYFRRRFWISLFITIPVLILSPDIQNFLGFRDFFVFTGDTYALWALSSAVYFYGGYPFFKGLYDELKTRAPGMMTLVAMAVTVAYVYSTAVAFGFSGQPFFWEFTTLIDVMLLGHWIEMRSVLGASRALEEMARLMPAAAHRLMPDGSTIDVPLEELLIGYKILVKPGEKIPADGDVVSGETAVNESMLTGESVPVEKQSGSKVIGGSINGEGSITVEVRKTGKESYLSQVIELVREAQESKSRTQDIATRAAMWLTVIAITAGAATAFVWLIILRQSLSFALERTVSVMVITCPHALGLAVPLVVAVSTALSARNGLLIRDRTAFEQARNIQAVLFDKTGTLTEGKFGVTDTLVFDKNINEKELLEYAASLESNSEHPIARGIVAAAPVRFPVEKFRAIPGRGAEGNVNGKEVKAVSPGYLKENNILPADGEVDRLTSQGKTVIFVLIDGKLMGAIALTDIVRRESKQAIAELKSMGIRCMMLTGDNQRVAKWVADETGLDEYFAEVLPDKKAEKVKEIQARGLTVAMTGDGVNDAPALAQADVGIAVGAGTDVAIATADIILIRSNPMDVVTIVELARATYNKMVQNLLWATGYNVIAIPLAAGVLYNSGILLPPALAAVFMSLSTVIVSINSRFLRIRR